MSISAVLQFNSVANSPAKNLQRICKESAKNLQRIPERIVKCKIKIRFKTATRGQQQPHSFAFDRRCRCIRAGGGGGGGGSGGDGGGGVGGVDGISLGDRRFTAIQFRRRIPPLDSIPSQNLHSTWSNSIKSAFKLIQRKSDFFLRQNWAEKINGGGGGGGGVPLADEWPTEQFGNHCAGGELRKPVNCWR